VKISFAVRNLSSTLYFGNIARFNNDINTMMHLRMNQKAHAAYEVVI